MERLFKVKVNGKEYDVAVREITENVDVNTTVQNVTTAPVVKKEAVNQPEPVKQEEKKVEPVVKASEGAIKVTAPMPGNIWKMKTTIGAKVEKHEVLLILEAMKMENEIVAPEAGTVTNILVKEGDAVNPGQIMIEIG